MSVVLELDVLFNVHYTMRLGLDCEQQEGLMLADLFSTDRRLDLIYLCLFMLAFPKYSTGRLVMLNKS